MRAVPATPGWLALAGLLPQAAFFACVIWGAPTLAGPARIAGGLYAGLILSFLGGAWWGIASSAPAAQGRGVLGWVWMAAVLPSLVALGAGLWWLVEPARPQPALVVLGFSLLASPLVDTRIAAMALVPHWWTSLRWPPSVALGLVTLALAVR